METTHNGVTRRAALRGVGGGLAVAGLGAGLAGRVAAQEATPPTVTELSELGTVGTLFTAVVADLPPAPVEVTLARLVTQPGEGDLEDYFTFPGPLAFVVESGRVVCRCGTAEAPCFVLRADGTSEPAAPLPADIPLGPGEGLYIPANTPDSFTNPGPDPEVELDLTIWPAGAQATPAASPTA